MSNANESAFPKTVTENEFDRGPEQYFANTYSTGGLTKREYYAAMAMQGMVVEHVEAQTAGETITSMMRDAVRFADALLAELAKEKTE